MLLVGCSEEEQAPAETVAKTVNVETETLKPELFEQYLKLVGTVEAQNDVRLSAEVSGRIEQYYVDQGDEVAKGEPLLQIDDDRLQREVDRLQAQTQQAREQYQRLKRVFEQDSVGSKMEVINAKANYEQSLAALKAAQVNLRNTTVEAPFDATVEEIVLEQGEMASPGTVLVRLIGTNQLKVSTGVPSTYANTIAKGDTAEIWFDFQQADTLKLPISFVGKAISPEARTFEVEIKLPPKSQNYKVDMISNVKIQTFRTDSAIVIGKEFLYQNEQQNVVYLVGQDKQGRSIARRQPVQLGATYQNEVVVEQGLNQGDRMITVGSSFLQDSMRITVVEDKQKNIVQEN